MRKILIIIIIFKYSWLFAQIDTVQHNVYMDASGYEKISVAASPKVALTGNYTDLSSKPTIPTNTNQLTNGSGFITGGNLLYNILSKSSNYTIQSSDFNTAYLKVLDLYVDASGGSVTITMPSAISGYVVFVTKTDSSSNAITISGVTSSNTLTTQYQSRQFNTQGTNWYNH